MPIPRARRPIYLQLIGPVSLRRTDGRASAPLLTQPRPLAVLIYLVLARPRGLHSRDTLIALLWPDATQESGRHALRNALHALRTGLGERAIVTAGDTLVGADAGEIRCDVLDLEEELKGADGSAWAGEAGELLQGFHVGGAPEFEDWLAAERERARALALRVAHARSEARRASGDIAGAISAARNAAALSPADEPTARSLLGLLVESGDRAGALQHYRELAKRLREEHGVEPSPETRGVIESLRGTARASAGEATPPPPASVRSPASPRAAASPSAPLHASSPASASRRGLPIGWAAALVAIPLLLTLLTTGARDLSPDPSASPRAASALDYKVPRRYRSDTALMQRYLRADALLERSEESAARESLQAIVEQAPLYAPAWAGLSSALSLSAFSDLPPRVALPQAVTAAHRALGLDSSLIEAHATLIVNDLSGSWDLPAAKRRLDTVMALHPDDPLLTILLGSWHRWRGEMSETVRLDRRALALAPLSPRFAQWVGGDLYIAHRCAEAAEVFRRGHVEFRNRPQAKFMLYRALRCLGRTDDAAAALREFVLESGDTALASLFAPPLTPDRRDAAIRAVFRARLDRYLAARERSWHAALPVVQAYAELRNADSVLVWLDSMYAERAMALHKMPYDPALDFMRADPRFQAFLRRLPWRPAVDQIPEVDASPPGDR
jgi:DNA-binding SARP family transcriptional activator